MRKIFINHTNYPTTSWSEEKLKAARVHGEIVEIPSPTIEAEATVAEVREVVQEQLEKILAMNPTIVLCQGEFNYTFAMVERLKNFGVQVVAATSKRVAHKEIFPDGSTRQVAVFRFVQFRGY